MKGLIRGLVSRLPRFPQPYPELLYLARNFHSSKTPPQILLLGDSVTERVSKWDTDRRPLYVLVAAQFKGKYSFTCISHSAYHMKVYEALLGVLQVMLHKPRLVILPINMRSFSPQWDLRPSWQFNREIEALSDYRSDTRQKIPFIKNTPGISDENEIFDTMKVQYPYSPFITIGQFRLIVNAKPQSREQFEYRKKQIFIFHYLHELEPRHSKIQSLIRVVETMQAMKVPLLLYITPINYQAGCRFVGNSFLDMFENNVRVVRQALQPYLGSEIRFLDLSCDLGAEQFFNPDDATEHLNQNGRLALASRITETAMNILSSKGTHMP